MRIGIVAGEKSGDYLGAELIKSLQQFYPNAEFVGLCGPQMIQQGAKTLADMDKISIIGFDGLLSSLREILHIRRQLSRYFLQNKPDLFIGIDVPDFNLTLEKKLKNHNIPVVHYVSPTVWAWRSGRIKKIRASIDFMLTLFPFEETYYQKQNIPVSFVGHPLAAEIKQHKNQPSFRKQFVNSKQKMIALLPGSRRSEIKRLAKLFIDTAKVLHAKDNSLQFVIPLATPKIADYFKQFYQDSECDFIHLLDGQARSVLAACDLVLLASGTAALEAALFAKPMVVAYKVSWLTELIARYTATVKHFSMPNHLLDEPIVPECIQHNLTLGSLVNELTRFLTDQNYYDDMQKALATILPKLACDSGLQAATAVHDFYQQYELVKCEAKQCI